MIKELVGPRIPVMVLMATYIIFVATISSQDGMAYILGGRTVDDVAVAGNTISAEAANQTANGDNMGVEFLSIQSARSGSISQSNATYYVLKLSSISDKTVLFSDRPNRIVTYVSTVDFIGNWTAGQNSFGADAPNAALVAEQVVYPKYFL